MHIYCRAPTILLYRVGSSKVVLSKADKLVVVDIGEDNMLGCNHVSAARKI